MRHNPADLKRIDFYRRGFPPPREARPFGHHRRRGPGGVCGFIPGLAPLEEDHGEDGPADRRGYAHAACDRPRAWNSIV